MKLIKMKRLKVAIKAFRAILTSDGYMVSCFYKKQNAIVHKDFTNLTRVGHAYIIDHLTDASRKGNVSKKIN